MAIFEKNIDDNQIYNNVIELKAGGLSKNIYKKGLYSYSKKPVLIGLHKINPAFNQSIAYIQSVYCNNGFKICEVLQEFLNNNDELIFADPITIIKKVEIVAISNNKTILKKYLTESINLLINNGFVKTIFKKKNTNIKCDVYVYSNEKGKFFNKLYNERKY